MGDLEKNIGRRIRRLRRARRAEAGGAPMTIAALAGAAGLSVDFLNKLELGRYMPSAETLVAIAEALDVGVKELFPTQRGTADNGEALDELHAVVSQYNARQIRYLILVIQAVMRFPRDAK